MTYLYNHQQILNLIQNGEKVDKSGDYSLWLWCADAAGMQAALVTRTMQIMRQDPVSVPLRPAARSSIEP